jgi:hypothetical protein
MLATSGGIRWWQKARNFTFLPDFVADVDKQLNKGGMMPLIFGLPEPSATAVSSSTTRVR